MSDLFTAIAAFFDRHLKRRPMLYKLLVGLGFIVVIGLFVRNILSVGNAE